jgi:nucleoside-diphosphate-sugar epimerase
MRVLVAGDRGYNGTVLVPFLRAAEHTVEGLDLGLYQGYELGPGPVSAPDLTLGMSSLAIAPGTTP